MKDGKEQEGQAKNDEICDMALKHYERVSTEAHDWLSTIPKAIEIYRLYLEAVKDGVPEDRKTCTCEKCSACDFNDGFNSARSQFIPLLMERNREIAELSEKYVSAISLMNEGNKLIDDLKAKLGGKWLYEDLCNRLVNRILTFSPDEHDIELNLCGIISKAEKLQSQLASAQERIEKLEMERDYEQDKRMEAQEKIKELEKEIEELVKARPVQVSFSDEAGKVLFKQMKEELASAKERIQDLSDLLEQHRQQYATKCEEAIKLEAIAERVKNINVEDIYNVFHKSEHCTRVNCPDCMKSAEAIKQWLLGEEGK